MPDKPPPTLTYRALVVGLAAMVFMALWIHYHEVMAPTLSILAENSPPAGAVGIVLGLLVTLGGLTLVHRRLRLSSAELVVIYTMLVIAAPLMSQGMWHRFPGLVVAIPETSNNLVDAYSDKLWPHGPHLIEDRRFEDEGALSRLHATPSERVRIVEVAESQVGQTRGVALRGAPKAGPEASGDGAGGDRDGDGSAVSVRIRVPTHAEGEPVLIPGHRYYLTALVNLKDLTSRSGFAIDLETAAGGHVPVVSMQRDTTAAYSRPGGFQRVGQPYVSLPAELGEYVDVVMSLRGQGTALVTDVNFFSNMAMSTMRTGATEVTASDAAALDPAERESSLVRPDNLASPGGIWYAVKGYIPYRAWLVPMAYWGSIVVAMFTCLMGLGVIFRKQWGDHERFTFPLVVLPRMLLEETEQDGKVVRPLFRKPAFIMGMVIALCYSLLQGLSHYVAGMPDPTIHWDMAQGVTSPAVRAFLRGSFNSQIFQVSILFLAIALLIDLDMLLSFLIFLWVCKIPNALGELLGWKTIRGPVDSFPFAHEQHIGAFLSLAIVVLWVSRRHLAGVGRRILGMPGGADDRGESMSYRSAFLLIIGSFIFFGVWGAMTGLGTGSALLFFGFLVVCGLSAARIRTEVGAPATYFTPYYPYLIFFVLGGLGNFSLETMLLAYLAGGFMAVAQFLMFAPSQVEMMQLAQVVPARPRAIPPALIVGVLGGVLLGGYVMLVAAYGEGSDNIHFMKTWAMSQNWYYNTLRTAVNDMDAASQAAGATAEAAGSVGPLVGVGVGAGVTILLATLRTLFVGFWLHPIGYILANTHFSAMCWGSLLVAWAIKWVTLKVGGPRVVRDHLTPLAVGLFAGGVAALAAWDVLALVLLSQGYSNVFVTFP